MSSFIGNNETSFVYVQADTIDCITNTAIPTPPIVKVPFPPPITAKDLIVQKKGGEVPSRSPNAFLIYRRLFVKELQAQNYAFKMTDVSTMAATNWKQESEQVKRKYLEIAGEAKNILTTTRHKYLCFSRRKRSQNHSNKNNNTRTPKAKTSSIPQSPREKQQIFQSSTQEPKQQSKHQFQSLNIPQPTIDNVEDCLFFSPSFAATIEEVDNFQSPVSDVLVYSDGESSTSADIGIDDLLDQPNYWIQSPVSDVSAYFDGESSTSADIGIDDLFDQPNYSNYWIQSPISDVPVFDVAAYKQFMYYWHLKMFETQFNMFYVYNQFY
ncbi:hypothetical protein RclHR1_08960007 [Rhizophagus clarus]|nr:hypothetical protein RclHR1_08960007 [Rhizophagus clarus]